MKASEGQPGVAGALARSVVPMDASPVPASIDPALLTFRATKGRGRPQGDRQRQLLATLVQANHGVHVRRAATLLGLDWNTCFHHARRLQASGLILMRRVSGRICLFDPKAGAVSHQVAPLLVRDARNAQMLRLVIATPGINQETLAAAIGLTPSATHRRLVRLADAGLVRRVRQGRSMVLDPTDTLLAAWEHELRPDTTDAVPQAAPALDGFLPTDGLLPTDAPSVGGEIGFDVP
jgi:predicted transcriptional regulator